MSISDSCARSASTATFGRDGTSSLTLCLLINFPFSSCFDGCRSYAKISRVSSIPGKLSLSGVMSVPFVGSRDSASAA